MTQPTFLERLSNTTLLANGAMGTMLHTRGVGFDKCFDELNLTNPSAVAEIHREHIEAGTQLIITNTSAASWDSARNKANATRGAIILEDHFKVFKLLPAAESELGLGLSASGQIIPEESTAAIVVPHKDAKYYTLGESRVEQLMR